MFIFWKFFAGVQIAYFAIIGTQISMVILSILLLLGIYKVSLGEEYLNMPKWMPSIYFLGTSWFDCALDNWFCYFYGIFHLFFVIAVSNIFVSFFCYLFMTFFSGIFFIFCYFVCTFDFRKELTFQHLILFSLHTQPSTTTSTSTLFYTSKYLLANWRKKTRKT